MKEVITSHLRRMAAAQPLPPDEEEKYIRKIKEYLPFEAKVTNLKHEYEPTAPGDVILHFNFNAVMLHQDDLKKLSKADISISPAHGSGGFFAVAVLKRLGQA